ncbi:hypothetical protein IWW34DRAFT_746524 [Fusarium oxysporum f. sp. albedinis]|nr:hypothetical protein IWW34DRAFT_746524 [Fusarium oxysporum f. sp. albedinis]KAJ0139650.1 Dynamin-1-like protein [Fusarium oxysporum f. sp. albedinis]KAK2473413.1 hypothetical protein H9L39_15588 [Fusarium oxysporum f. sp. albedinis]
MPFAVGTATTKQDLAVAQAEAPQLAKVKWWADPGMRVLYFYAAILCVCSATTGYDSDRNGLVWSGMGGQTKPYQMLT